MAYPIKYPGIKLKSAVLIYGGQGLGKSMLGETVNMLYEPYSITITQSNLSSSFNSYISQQQFILAEEVSQSDSKSASGLLKHYITGETIIINEKFKPEYTLPNKANFMFLSNRSDAIYLDNDDRRFFVVKTPTDKLSDDFFTEFANWRENGGLQHLFYYLQHYDVSDFNKDKSPPITEAKMIMQDGNQKDIDLWVQKLKETPDQLIYMIL